MARELRSMAMFSMCSAALAVGCSTSASTEEETFEVKDHQVEFHGESRREALSKEEWATYRADRKYVRSLARGGEAVGLNHADPKQHRFALLRLKLAGKTAKTAPELIRGLEQLKVEHEARGLAIGTVENLEPQADEVTSQHAALATGGSASQGTVTAGALASRKDQLSYGYVDSTTWDEEGNPLGDTTYKEVFGNLRFSTTLATGTMAEATGTVFEGDSFLSERLSNNTTRTSYAVAAPKDFNALNSLTTPTIIHPQDRDGDGYAVVCLERNSGDCEYNNMGMWTLRLPMQGNLSVAGAGMTLDLPQITAYQNGAALAPGKIYATLGANGGGCRLPAAGATTAMQSFWKKVLTSPANNPTTLAWDLATNAADWADFTPACQLIQAQVYVTMELEIPFKNTITGKRGTLPITISNAPFDRPLTPPNLSFKPPYRVTNSCLAAGTLVAVAGSEARKIEEIGVGDSVANPYTTRLTVIDRSEGTEKTPMVRIADAKGRELLMTEAHPIAVIGRGMIAAKDLKAGDRVQTVDGASELVRVSREPYSGKVFNLKVGNQAETQALGVDQTAMYANGFLVGDMQIQGKHELLEQEARMAQPSRLSAKWRKDYEASLAAQRAAN